MTKGGPTSICYPVNKPDIEYNWTSKDYTQKRTVGYDPVKINGVQNSLKR